MVNTSLISPTYQWCQACCLVFVWKWCAEFASECINLVCNCLLLCRRCCVQSIEATSAIGTGQVIGEYTGNVMLREEYEHNKQFDVYVQLCNILSSLLLSQLTLLFCMFFRDCMFIISVVNCSGFFVVGLVSVIPPLHLPSLPFSSCSPSLQAVCALTAVFTLRQLPVIYFAEAYY